VIIGHDDLPRRSTGLSAAARTFFNMPVARAIGLAAVALIDAVAIVWGAGRVRQVLRLLASVPPAEPRVPCSRLEQLAATYLGRLRGWVVVFSAALVGAAVSDYDRDPKHGLGRMLGLFLFVSAVLIIPAGVSLARAGRVPSRMRQQSGVATTSTTYW
jgi:hypothetical protein